MSDDGNTRFNDLTKKFEDLPIRCVDCTDEFVWTAGEQAFYHYKELQNAPKRCKPCKQAKNIRLRAINESRDTGKPPRIEVDAKCASCEKSTTLPFYPSQGRPVYCRKCYLRICVNNVQTAKA